MGRELDQPSGSSGGDCISMGLRPLSRGLETPPTVASNWLWCMLYFAMYDACCILPYMMHTFFAQVFEGKVRVCLIRGCNDYPPWV